MKRVIAILMIALMAVSVIACGSQAKKEDAQSQIVGTWDLDVESMLGELSEEERAAMEAFGMTADMYKIEFIFRADGTGSSSMSMMGQTENIDFTYTEKDGKIELTSTVDGETNTSIINYTIDGDTLVMSEGEQTMTFKRK